MVDLTVMVAGPLGPFDSTMVQMVAMADVDLSDPQADCIVPCAVVTPPSGEQQDKVLGFVVYAKAGDLIRYCQDGLGAFMRTQFLGPMSYEATGAYSCAMATDMVAVAEYLGEAGSDKAPAWPIGKREFVLLLISSQEFQSDCARALASDSEVQGVTVLMPSDDTVGRFVEASIPAECLEQHEHYDDLLLAPPAAIVPAIYGSDDQQASGQSQGTSWLPWTLVGLAAVGAGVVVYDQVKTRKEQRP